ncbi:MAG: alpha-ketoglutarate-dependent dioxygenase AlkB [Bacteriovoracaceae bacterium]|nr:alpha-ketoglutarate-dependent dioxygenase AlkB [Bacteriovoracaceae bacterium]
MAKAHKAAPPLPNGLIYQPLFLTRPQREETLSWLKTLHPLWEMRFSKNNPPPEGDKQRRLLRPVYWLGNWQFACLDYYHPPEGIENRCVRAENYPKFLADIVARIEFVAKKRLPKNFIPENWTLNTCLINFYGSELIEGKWVDNARVGEHKDFEPGPVGSLSFGDRAFFQFVEGKSTLGKSNEVLSLWLEDSSLQVFAGDKWKKQTFHRVQRVEDKKSEELGPVIEGFKTRRINFTFRYVPEQHIVPWRELPAPLREDTLPYMQALAANSLFFNKSI